MDLDLNPSKRTYQLSSNTFAGMTKKSAGNFRPNRPFDTVGKTIGVIDPSESTRVFVMRAQEHTSRVLFWNDQMSTEEVCDGVVWNGPGTSLCFPGGCPVVIFGSPNQNLWGMLHTSWKTVSQRIITNFLTTWEFAGGNRRDTTIRFLPAICSHCLTFDEKYWENVRRQISWSDPHPENFIRKIGGKIGFNLVGFSAHIMRQCGYEAEDRSVCTCHSKEYWCYRCDDRNGHTHRNAAFLVSTSTPLA